MTVVVMNPAGIRAVLTHPAVTALIDERAGRIRAAAGDGFRVKSRPQRVQRYGAQVRTADETGRRAQADNNALIKAVDAGR